MRSAPDENGLSAEKALQDCEAQLRDYVEIAADWFWELDENLRATSLMGRPDVRPQGEWRGKTRWEVNGADPSRSPWKEHVEMLQARQPFRNFEYTVTGPNGETLWISASGKPIFDQDGTFRGYRGVTTEVTERRKAELEQQASEERYRALVNASASLVWRASPDGLMIEGSGWGEYSDYRGSQWIEMIHPDDRERMFSEWQAIVASGLPGEQYCRARRLDGDYRWCAARSVPIKNADGSIREWVGTLTDIHDQKVAQEAIAKSEERLRLATEATAIGTYDIDLRTGAREWSPEMRTILGLLATDPIGRDVLASRIHPDDRHWVVEMYDQALAQAGDRLSAEFRIIRANDGEVRWVSTTGRTIADETGHPARAVGVLRDITSRKAAELGLRESEERYRLLAEHSIDMIVRTGADGICRYISPACREILGLGPEAFIGTRLNDVTHPDDAQALVSGLKDLFSGRAQQLTMIYRIRHKAGHWVWLESRRRLVRDQEGNPREVISVVRDLTERLRMEEQLRQAQKMEAMGQLTGGVAHDFNNLLTVILGNAEILVDDPGNAALTSTLSQMILEAAEKGSELTQHLLAFGRRQSLKPVRVSLDHVVQGMMPLLERTLGEHIELKTLFSKSPLAALADRALLESAILNLALNARDAMPEGGTLTITTGETVAGPNQGALPAGQDVVFVTMSDTGTGMSPEVLEHAFEPFFTTKEVGKGSGLGLSMVYGFAQQSGGHVSIRSKVGEGASVTMYLPAVTSPAPETQPLGEGALPAAKKERILLVEDEPQVLQFVSSQLVGLGYEVTAVSAGPDALDLLREDGSFDLLFTDVVLPKGVSGVELAKRARRIRPELKALLTSGYAEEVFEHHGRPEEGTLLLRKPFRRKDLAEKLRKVLEPPAS